MTGYTRRDLPADIAVFAGDFASQPWPSPTCSTPRRCST
jgi:hypothetical protein